VLPSGTVTFLFTDIEGSTRLLQRLGDRYPDVLGKHQEVLRSAFASHGGHEIDTQGDSFFVAFERARDAVAAAIAAQRGLAETDWPDDVQVMVRMGLHSGDPVVGSDTYTGLGVHRAARISALGHGGQVLISNATRELIKDDLPTGVRIRDLGVVRLKDLEETEHVHQLVIEGLPSDFPPLATERRPLYRRPAILAAGLAGLAAIAAVALLTGRESDVGPTVRPNSVAAIDPESGRVVAQVPVGQSPFGVTFAAGSLWVASDGDRTVSRVDIRRNRVVRSLPVKDEPMGIRAAGGAVWVTGLQPGLPRISLRRIDPQFDSVGEPIHIGNVVPGGGSSVAASGDRLWIAPQDGLLSRLDTQSGRVVETVDPKTSPSAVAIGPDAVWVAGEESNTLTRIDPTGLLTPISVGHAPISVAVGAGAVWVVDTLDDAVVRIDPKTNAVKTTIAVGHRPDTVVVAAGSVWVSNGDDGTISRIDPKTAKVADTIRIGGSARGMAFASGKLWVAVGESAPAPRTRATRGTLHLAAQDDPGPIDPALVYTKGGWQLLGPTCAKLLNYPDKPAPQGSQLQPEVATSLPVISDGGRTYTYTVRKGFRFSPPSNQPVTAETFKYTIERTAAPKMHSPAGTFLTGIAGYEAYASGKARDLAGVVARGDTLTIRLAEPAPNLPVRLAMPFFCAVPIGTPVDPSGVARIPMAGPYYFAPEEGVAAGPVLLRNPNYSGNRPRRFKRIELTTGLSPKQTIRLVEQGKADYALDGVGIDEFPRIRARYSANKPGVPRLLANPLLSVSFVLMNTTRGPFTDPRLRRALNYAIDRKALARLGNPGSEIPGRPTDQYLPPGMSGFADVDIYPSSPDVATARKLARRHRRTRVVLYVCNQSPCDKQAQLIKTAVESIGMELEIKTFSVNQMFARLPRPGEPFDVTLIGWLADYPDPDNFLDLLLLKGSGITPPLEDPIYAPRLEAAAKLSGPRRYLTYGQLDAEIARNSAPWAAYANGISYDFFSARMGCQIYQPLYGIDLAALCAR
jgi:YVTN family beta-propeller protein